MIWQAKPFAMMREYATITAVQKVIISQEPPPCLQRQRQLL